VHRWARFKESFHIIDFNVQRLRQGSKISYLHQIGAQYFVALRHGQPFVRFQQYSISNNSVNPQNADTVLQLPFWQWDRFRHLIRQIENQNHTLAQTVPCTDMWHSIPNSVEHPPFTNLNCRECMPFVNEKGKIVATPVSTGVEFLERERKLHLRPLSLCVNMHTCVCLFCSCICI